MSARLTGKATTTIARCGLFLLLAVAVGCSRDESGEQDLQSSSQLLHAHLPAESMGASQARAIIRAEAILAQAEALDPGTRSLKESEAFRSVLAEARKSVPDPDAEFKAAREWSLELSAHARSEVVSQATALLQSASTDFSNGAASHALLTTIKGEAALELFKADLVAAGAGRELPATALELVPPPHLEDAIEGFNSQLRGMQEQESIVADGTRSLLISDLKERLQEMKAAAKSPQRTRFIEQRVDIFKHIDKDKWKALAATRDERLKEKFSKSVAAAESAVDLPELLLQRYEARGPPDSFALESARNFDIDPTRWCRSEAQLAALADALRRDASSPQRVRPPADLLASVSATLEDETLKQLVEIAAKTSRTQDTWLPSDYIFPEKQFHLRSWSAAAQKEIELRKGGATKVVSASYLRNTPALQREVDARFLEAVEARFSSPEVAPTMVVKERNRIIARTLRDFDKVIAEHLSTYTKVARKVALSDRVLSQAEAASLSAARTSAAELIRQLRSLRSEASSAGLTVAPEPDAIAAASALADLPPETPTESQGVARARSTLWTMQDRARASRLEKHAYLIHLYAGQLEAAVTAASEFERTVEPLRVRPYGAEKGRLVVAQNELLRPGFSAESLALDETQPRLPESRSEWLGRLDENGKPYSFESEVRNPGHIEALGGGIHLGSIATLSDSSNLSSSSVLFEKGKGIVIRDGRTGQEWLVGGDIDPTSLRALYRFGSQNRNAAVSVGWGASTENRNPLSNSKVVYLDPLLVDTKVGQDLILADQRPWSFGEPASRLSFAPQFATATKAFRSQRESLKDFVDAIPMPDSTTAADLYSQEAIQLFARSRFENAKRAEVESEVARLSKSSPEIPAEQLREQARRSFEIKVDEPATIAKLERESQDVVGPGHTEERFGFLWREILRQAAGARGADAELISAWVRLGLSLEGTNRAMFAAMLDNIPATLAYLYDDRVSVALIDNGNVQFKTDMQYRYINQSLDFDGKRLRIKRDEKGRNLDTLRELTRLVNSNVDEVQKRYPDVARVRHYAEVAAFLRWLEQAKPGEIGLVDLSGLASFNAADRKRSPTVDEIKRD